MGQILAFAVQAVRQAANRPRPSRRKCSANWTAVGKMDGISDRRA